MLTKATFHAYIFGTHTYSTRMGKYQIEPVLSLISLPESLCHYGRPSEAKKTFMLTPQTKYNRTFVKATVPLEDESENRAISTWLYKEETLVDIIEQAQEITPKKYGPGLQLMKHFGYKGTGPIGCNNNDLIDPVKAIDRRNRDTSGLGFKKVPFHLGINKFVPKPDSSSKNGSQAKFDHQEDNDDDEDPYPYPIPYDLAKFFAKPNDFVT